MPIKFIEESGFGLGMIRDEPSWMIPKGGVYDALNLLQDTPGILRQRGGSTALVTGAQTAFATSIGFVHSQDATLIEELYGLDGKAGGLTLINKTTGATTALGTPAATGVVGRPARHFGFLVFPVNANAQVTHGAISVAGETVNTSFTNGVAATMTAGNPQITLTGADVTTNVKVGAVVRSAFVDVATTNWIYWGRVVSIDTTKLFTVWPTPTVSGTAAIGSLTTGPSRASAAGGVCATSFQNRLLIGNTMDLAASSPLRNDRRVIYSILPTETNGGNIGATFVDSGSWPRLNYFDVPGSDPIIAMEPVGDNELLILTSTHPVLFSGNLTTQVSTTSPTVTFNLSDFDTPSGCLSDLSVQRTPRGIVWAGSGGIYAYSGGGKIEDLTRGRISTLWRKTVLGSSAVIHGSAYIRGHYLICGTSAGSAFSFLCNLDNQQWTRLSGVGTDIFAAVPRPNPAFPGQVFAARWWDQTNAAPSMTNGQTLRLETMLDAYTAGSTRTDADGGTIPILAITRTISGGDLETQKLFQRFTVRYQQSSTTAALTVGAKSLIDASEADAAFLPTLGNLSNTNILTVTNATNANPIVVTTSVNHGLQTDDFVDINAVAGNTNANGRYRIAVTGATTFSLVGGIGNAAYTSNGKVKKLTESDFLMSALNAGQGATVHVGGSPDNFEFHGVTLAVLQKEPVMSA